MAKHAFTAAMSTRQHGCIPGCVVINPVGASGKRHKKAIVACIETLENPRTNRSKHIIPKHITASLLPVWDYMSIVPLTIELFPQCVYTNHKTRARQRRKVEIGCGQYFIQRMSTELQVRKTHPRRRSNVLRSLCLRKIS